jgi:predicted nucleic acid-binding protein
MRSIVIDANLLLLLVVGTYNRQEVSRHRRLAADYDLGDFENLLNFLGNFECLTVVPGTLTEVSNLISHADDPVSAGIKDTFATLIHSFVEVYEPSKQVVQIPAFSWLGLSDAAQLSAALEQKCALLTNDGPLLAAASDLGIEVVHFSALEN